MRHLLVLLPCLAVCRTVTAQDTTLVPVDQGVEDVGVLSHSLRQVEAGLEVPSGFDEVYRVSGHSNLFMRVDGAIYAVFPTSSYDAGLAVIPSNTVFFIGRPSEELLRHYAGDPFPMTVSAAGRLDMRIVDDGGRGPIDGASLMSDRSHVRNVTAPAIVADAEYRRDRLRTLLRGVAARIE